MSKKCHPDVKLATEIAIKLIQEIFEATDSTSEHFARIDNVVCCNVRQLDKWLEALQQLNGALNGNESEVL